MNIYSDFLSKPLTKAQCDTLRNSRELPMRHYDALTQGTGYRVNPEMADCGVLIRRARKQHRCQGGHDGKKCSPCQTPIDKGTLYVEYLGESHPYKGGDRYHFQCATQQGLLIKVGTQRAEEG